METLQQRLIANKEAIIAGANAGDRQAEQIVTLHRMWVSAPGDPMAPIACEGALNDWLAARSKGSA